MSYKETLFFIAKCLTISTNQTHKNAVEIALKKNRVNWNSVVAVSTNHYVFPALYIHFKNAHFLHYLPKDLVNYMKELTTLNRDRNAQIIAQAKEVNELLLAHNIRPIFLKGTGNLLEGLYQDIAERMVGDIDFIVPKDSYNKAFEILLQHKYTKFHNKDYEFPQFKHKPRLIKNDKIAALEVHKEFLKEKYSEDFNFETVKESIQTSNNISFLSYKHQLCLSVIAKQINDHGNLFKNMALRNAYDVYLLSQKTSAKNAFEGLQDLANHLHNFLAICYEVFDKVDSLEYTETDATKKYVLEFYKQLNNNSLTSKKHKRIKNKLFLKARWLIIYKSLFEKSYRKFLFSRVLDKEWQQEKRIQLGLKKRSS
ncbi:nucleotidyltransferase family protein [Polaribacter tangerinus]|uniref:nucleotidyltransferase family protein n=1 Tax=Polaribacter tangerinus TaxID=1920034 RepID=UPI000B4B35AD|nr:nucleotidyltransferase family protein [Polaribacter tangerinus]